MGTLDFKRSGSVDRIRWFLTTAEICSRSRSSILSVANTKCEMVLTTSKSCGRICPVAFANTNGGLFLLTAKFSAEFRTFPLLYANGGMVSDYCRDLRPNLAPVPYKYGGRATHLVLYTFLLMLQ